MCAISRSLQAARRGGGAALTLRHVCTLSSPYRFLSSTGKVYREGTKIRSAGATSATTAEKADAAVAADAPRGMRGASDRSTTDAGATTATASQVLVPTAVLLWFDLRDVSSEQVAARKKLEEKLARERAERETQKLRIKALQAEVASLVSVRVRVQKERRPDFLCTPQRGLTEFICVPLFPGSRLACPPISP